MRTWQEQFTASEQNPVIVNVAERFAPDYPSLEGGFKVSIASLDQMLEFVQQLEDSYYSVGEPWFLASWTKKMNDGHDHWGIDVFECAPERED